MGGRGEGRAADEALGGDGMIGGDSVDSERKMGGREMELQSCGLLEQSFPC